MSKKLIGIDDIKKIPQKTINTIKHDSAIALSNSKVRTDGWMSALSGLGVVGKDKKSSAVFASSPLLPSQTLIDFYTNDDLSKNIVTLVSEAAFKNYGYVQNDDASEYDEGLLTYEMNRLNAPYHFKHAMNTARLLGGSLVYMGAMGSGSSEEELDPGRITSIEFLKVIPLTDIMTFDSRFDRDINSPTYGQITHYKVRIWAGNEYTEYLLHASRCIPFYGVKIPDGASHIQDINARYWGVSVLQGSWQAIRDYHVALSAVNLLLSENAVGVYKLSDLDEILSSPAGEKKLQARIMGIEISKSAIHGILLGTDEEYVRDSINMSGIDAIIEMNMMNVSSVCQIPVTKLFGMSNGGGLSTSSAGELTQFYDLAQSAQRSITPEIQKFINVLAEWKGLEKDHTWAWNSLYSLDIMQQAETDRKKAEELHSYLQADVLAIQSGVVSAEDIYKLRYEKDLGKRDINYFEELEPEPTDTTTEISNPISSEKETKEEKVK